VIRHSYKKDQENGSIWVEYKLDLQKLTIVITDEGERGHQFNPDLLSPVDKEEYLKNLTKGGLGIYLIKKIMDEVKYTVAPGVSNCLTMVKYARSAKEKPA